MFLAICCANGSFCSLALQRSLIPKFCWALAGLPERDGDLSVLWGAPGCSLQGQPQGMPGVGPAHHHHPPSSIPMACAQQGSPSPTTCSHGNSWSWRPRSCLKTKPGFFFLNLIYYFLNRSDFTSRPTKFLSSVTQLNSTQTEQKASQQFLKLARK